MTSLYWPISVCDGNNEELEDCIGDIARFSFGLATDADGASAVGDDGLRLAVGNGPCLAVGVDVGFSTRTAFGEVAAFGDWAAGGAHGVSSFAVMIFLVGILVLETTRHVAGPTFFFAAMK